MSKIDKGIRATNYIIDIIAIYFLWLIFVLSNFYIMDEYLLFYVITFSYYFILELFTKQTLGKMVTKTRVVHKNGGKPNAIKIFMRSLWRLIPIDIISYLFGTGVGMHDLLSSTRIMKEINNNS